MTAAPGEPDGTAEPVRDPYEDFNNHYMQAYTNGNKVDWAETEDYVFLGSKYYDKNTGECDFYCSKPECTHNDRRTCQAALYVPALMTARSIQRVKQAMGSAYTRIISTVRK